MTAIRVLVADDHTLVRAGLRGLLESVAGVDVVGEASEGHETLDQVQALQPDLLLLDIGMPGLNGLEITERLKGRRPPVRVLILSMHNSEEYVLRALRAGCAGYLLKGAAVSELETAIRAVADGATYLSPAVSRRVVDDYVGRTVGATGPLDMLTPRQREILQLVAEGNTSKDIAARLGLSFKTVEAHRAQIMHRLDVHELAGLVRLAVRAGLVAPDS